ncbi:MAG: PEP-CTERM sorting domain-containing protein [Kiritimatiellia bacterium]|jgi:hypothetical protein|nr:PEP-CTERM sorting domain-containing protein [Lentisphaerota bacterium]
MKNIFLVLIALALATTTASAGVGILWLLEYGAYTHDSPDVTQRDTTYALLHNYSVTWQLIYAGADNIANPVDLASPGWVSGDDEVWATRTIPLNGGFAPEDNTEWTIWMTPWTGDRVYRDPAWSDTGYVFQRIYEGTPQEGSWYYESALFAFNPNLDPNGGQQEKFCIDEKSSGIQPDRQILGEPIPEPATLNLLGLGTLALICRKRK